MVKATLQKDGALKRFGAFLAAKGIKIRSLPTCVLFADGEPVDTLVGRCTKQSLNMFVEPTVARFAAVESSAKQVASTPTKREKTAKVEQRMNLDMVYAGLCYAGCRINARSGARRAFVRMMAESKEEGFGTRSWEHD